MEVKSRMCMIPFFCIQFSCRRVPMLENTSTYPMPTHYFQGLSV